MKFAVFREYAREIACITHLFQPEMQQNYISLICRDTPGPAGESTALPDPLIGLTALLLRGGEGKGETQRRGGGDELSLIHI